MPNNKLTGNVLFPIFLKLHEIDLLVVGGGKIALEKLEAILRNSPEAKVTLVAKKVLQQKIFKLASQYPGLNITERQFEESDLAEKDLVILATDDRRLHEDIKLKCKRKHILTNVADTPDLCDFYLGSVVSKGDLKIAISSNGKSPTLTKRIRQYLEEALPDGFQQLIQNLEQLRGKLKGDFAYKVKKLNEVTEKWLENKG